MLYKNSIKTNVLIASKHMASKQVRFPFIRSVWAIFLKLKKFYNLSNRTLSVPKIWKLIYRWFHSSHLSRPPSLSSKRTVYTIYSLFPLKMNWNDWSNHANGRANGNLVGEKLLKDYQNYGDIVRYCKTHYICHLCIFGFFRLLCFGCLILNI